MAELSQPTQKLISRYQAWYQSLQPKEGETTIHVDEIASAVAAFYEKIREVVEWREEHLMRRAAIERILKRRLLLFKNGEPLAEPFVLELVRGGHFPNDRIPESKIGEVQKLIDKYIFIMANASVPPREKAKIQLYDWILGIAACEVEETLCPSQRENALIEYMMELMMERIKVREGVFIVGGLNEEEKNSQIFIAIQRALFKLDPPIITYNLLKRRYPQWRDFTKDSLQFQEIVKNIYSIWDSLAKNLKHPLAERFYKICDRYTTPYLILGDILFYSVLCISKCQITIFCSKLFFYRQAGQCLDVSRRGIYRPPGSIPSTWFLGDCWVQSTFFSSPLFFIPETFLNLKGKYSLSSGFCVIKRSSVSFLRNSALWIEKSSFAAKKFDRNNSKGRMKAIHNQE